MACPTLKPMRIPVVIFSLALALAGCLKVPESDNTGLILPLAAPDTAAGASGNGGATGSPPMTTSSLTVGAGYSSASLPTGGRHRFSFPTEANAIYSIQWDEGTISSANTLDVVVTALTDDGSVLYEQESSTPFNRADYGLVSRLVVAGPTDGIYYLDVTPYSSNRSGRFAIRVDKISRPITVESSAGASPTTDTLVSSEGYLRYYSFSANASTTYHIRWGDSYQGPGGCQQDVTVSLGRLNPTTAATWAFIDIDSGWSSPRTYTPSSTRMTYIAVKRYLTSSTTQTPPGFQIEVY